MVESLGGARASVEFTVQLVVVRRLVLADERDLCVGIPNPSYCTSEAERWRSVYLCSIIGWCVSAITRQFE